MTLHVLVDGRTIQDRWDGVGRLVYHLVERLAERPSIRLTLLTTTKPDARLSVRTLPPQIARIPFDQDVVSLASHTRWPAVIRRVDPDVVFVPYNLSAPFVSNVPLVVGVMDCILEAAPAFAPSRLGRLGYMAATRLALSRASAVVTISEQSRAHLTRQYGIDPDRTYVVLPGADERFAARPSDEATSRARRELRLPKQYVLHVGARRPHKNVGLLVKSFAQLDLSRRDLHLVLVGSTDRKFRDEVPELVQRLGLADRVRTLAGVPEEWFPAIYQNATLLAYPSVIEGYGFPPAEAMIAGTPVVASSGVPSVTETAAGVAAVILPPYGEHRWADAMAGLLDDPARRRRMSEEGGVAARAHGWEEAADQLEKVLRATAGT